jgi:hypothetical protein
MANYKGIQGFRVETLAADPLILQVGLDKSFTILQVELLKLLNLVV